MDDINVKPADEAVTYTKMTTTTRLNYRSSCDFKSGSIVGVLDENTTVNVVDNWEQIMYGHVWKKIKIGRKHYYVVCDWLE